MPREITLAQTITNNSLRVSLPCDIWKKKIMCSLTFGLQYKRNKNTTKRTLFSHLYTHCLWIIHFCHGKYHSNVQR